jgi:hypothetical protein
MSRARSDKPSIVEFVKDKELLGLSLSDPQEVLLRAIYGMSLTPTQREIFTLCTGREDYPGISFQEATVLCGARGGKDSRVACPIASYEATFGDHQRFLTPGEQAVVPLVAPGALGTRVAYNYIKSHFTESKLLKNMLDDEPTAGEIKLTNRTSIMCFPSTKSALRGWSIPVGILDEVGFFRIEGAADSDTEIQASVRRGMVGFPSTRLIKISTPFAKSGLLYTDFKDHYGKDSPDLLCWKATSAFMNPSLKASRLEREKRLDPLRYAREYEAEFSEDLDTFLPGMWIEGAVVQGRRELAPVPGVHYVAAVDVSGLGSGANADAFTLDVSHATADGKVVQDLMRGWRKSRSSSINLAGILAEIAGIITRYGTSVVHGDSYGKTWVSERFAEAEMSYVQVEHDKSFFYLQTEPLFAQGRVELLDNDELQREFKMLERRMMPGGKIKIDHPLRLHDDHANAFAISAVIAVQGIGGGEPAAVGARSIDPTADWLDQDRGDGQGSTINDLWDQGAFSRRGGGSYDL